MNNENWREGLNTPKARFSYRCLHADIAALSLIELWDLYRFSSRLADG